MILNDIKLHLRGGVPAHAVEGEVGNVAIHRFVLCRQAPELHPLRPQQAMSFDEFTLGISPIGLYPDIRYICQSSSQIVGYPDIW